MKYKNLESLESGEYLIATNKVSGEVEAFPLAEKPFRIGFKVDKHSFGNDYGVDDSVGGRVLVKDLDKGYMLPMLSREHCGLTFKDGERYIHDFGSRTGTYVNGERICAERLGGKRKLKNGDMIGLIPKDDEFLLELEYVVKD